MKDRIDSLYENLQNIITENRGIYSDKPEINLFADTEYCQMTYMQRKARYIEVTLDNADVRIFPDELIVGTFLGTWQRVLNTTYGERLAYSDMNHPYPERNSPNPNVANSEYHSKPIRVSTEKLKNPEYGNWQWGHICGGYNRILQMGYSGIAEDAKCRIAEMESSGNIDTAKIEFWEAVITSVMAVIRLSNRYADELEKMAYTEHDSRADELRQIAANMRYVPAHPARTFFEALQSIFFSWMCSVRFNGNDIGRLDQYLYPYYKNDLEHGIITKESAQELIFCFFLKCHEGYASNPVYNSGHYPSIMLGGLNADGIDGTNDITFMCMRAVQRLGTPTPKISMRINEQTPHEVFEIAHSMLLKGLNQPDFYADRVMIPAFQRIGIPFEDAVEYAQSICEEISLAGMSEDCTNEGPHCDVHDKVYIAMQRAANGEKADTFEEFIALVEEEMRNCILDEIEYHRIQTEKIGTLNPQPLHSAAIVGCLESGKDITVGGAKYNNTGSVIGGLATAADGLYAIKRLVYDEKRLSIGQFLQILDNNYDGHEVLRSEILNKFPKFGNDDDNVDSIAVRLFDIFADELEKHKNSRGGCFKVGAWASEYRSPYMATPDGRRRGDTFAVNVSPTPGHEIKGVTAVIRSGTKLNMKICTAGAMLDVAMNPSCISGENGVEILKQLVTVYGNLGGGGIQFNIIDESVLRSAQTDPSKYKNLMVRVWGYNDYFIALEKRKQEHVIARTIHNSI